MSAMLQQQAILDAVRQWQTRLLQLDRRNGLLYFAMDKRGVALRDIKPHVFLNILNASRSGLAFDYAERVRVDNGDIFDMPTTVEGVTPDTPQVRIRQGDLDTDLPPLELQKRLGKLSKRNREWQEEQGLNVLFIALGFLRWVDDDEEKACSPILLFPCDLTRKSPRDPYILVGDDAEDVVVNPTLRHKLATTAGIMLPEFEEQNANEYLATVEQLVAGREGWSVTTDIVIATFPFSKLAMWEDLNLIAKSGVTHPLVRCLAGDTNTQFDERDARMDLIPKDDDKLHGGRLDDLLNIRDQYAVLDADFSQLRAIELSRSGANLVIHGPPGTGKSQTIANIIATLLADGRRVLFVSEKTAALDVVKRRLTEVGLGGFCLDLHSDRAKKASVYAQLRENVHQQHAATQEFPYERLIARRDELNGIVRALHEVRQPLGLSVFEVQGRVSAIKNVPRLSIVLHDIAALDAERLLGIHDAVSRIARRTTEFREHHTSRWLSLGSITPSPGLADAVHNDLAPIELAINAIVPAVEKAATVCGVANPTTLAEVAAIFRLLAHLRTAPGAISAQWLEPRGLEHARNCANTLRDETAVRKSLLDALSISLGNRNPGSRSNDWLDIARTVAAQASRWERTAGSRWSSDILTNTQSSAVQWHGIANVLNALADASQHLQKLLGDTHPLDTGMAAQEATTLAARLVAIGTVPASWNSVDGILAHRAELTAGRQLRDDIVTMENALAELFVLDIVDQVDRDMLVRYKTDYRPLWRWFLPQYRRDNRTLRGCLKHPGSLSLDHATSAIERALKLKQLRSRWFETARRLQEIIGDRFNGIESEWSAIDLALDVAANSYREYPEQASVIHSILSDKDFLARVKETASLVRDLTVAVDAAWPDSASRRDKDIRMISADARAFAEAAGRIRELLDCLGPFLNRPVDMDNLIEILNMGTKLHELDERAAAAAEPRSRAIGDLFSGWSTDFGMLNTLLDWTRDLLTLIQCPLPDGLLDRVIHMRLPATYAAVEDMVAATVTALRAAFADAAKRFPEACLPWKAWDFVPFDLIRMWCEDLRAHAEEANAWLEYRSANKALDEVVGVQITDALRAVTEDAALVPDIVLRHVYLAWIERLYLTESS